VGAAGYNAATESLFSLLQKKHPRPPEMGHPRGTADRHRDLDRPTSDAADKPHSAA
jgi:hypothetical protein